MQSYMNTDYAEGYEDGYDAKVDEDAEWEYDQVCEGCPTKIRSKCICPHKDK